MNQEQASRVGFVNVSRFGVRPLLVLLTAFSVLLLFGISTKPIQAAAWWFSPAAVPAVVQAFSVTGGTPSGSDNDYTRINNAILAASSGTIIELQGTFDWTEANAAASWALGSDGVASTSDDFAISIPPALNNLTITAGMLGAATIDGPGDLAAVNLEGFLICDGGDNQNLSITNLQIRNFDLAIGMFNGAGGVDAFNGSVITNNYILVPVDLNASVAPGDVNQNIGIHFSFGVNQTISSNTIELAGNGVSNTGTSQFSSSVGMQSNTSGGAVYDGLLIDNNTLRVLNAQSADPDTILGIWENGHAHTSDITVSNNTFINMSPANNPALNVQRAFRVTSHSSASTTTTYSGNTINGANIGFQWITGSDFTGNQAVNVLENAVINCATGVLVQSNGVAEIHFNRIVGTGVGVNNASGIVNAENNWWGCNAGPGGAGCTTVSGTVDFNPWLVLTISAAPPSIGIGQTSTITASLTMNSDGVDTSGLGHVPDGTPVTFGGGAPVGTVAPTSTVTTLGVATSDFTAGGLPGSAMITATVDGQTVTTTVTVTGVGGVIACVQDDTTKNFMLINTSTGEYAFVRCNPSLTLMGVGTVKVVGCTIRLTHVAVDRRVTASIDGCQKKGSAAVQTFNPGAVFTIIDRNTTNNTCGCPL